MAVIPHNSSWREASNVRRAFLVPAFHETAKLPKEKPSDFATNYNCNWQISVKRVVAIVQGEGESLLVMRARLRWSETMKSSP